MTGLSDTFRTGVRSSDGRWPAPPATWSYSSLREVEQCPRRWMLSRATYSDLWSGWGYPPRPAVAAMVGDIVHAVLELLVRRLRESGCTSLADPGAVGLLKELGGYTRLVKDGIEHRLGDLAGNPRAADRIGPLRTELLARSPDMRQRIQALVARNPYLLAPRTHAVNLGSTSRLTYGAHPEIEVRALTLRLAGRVDLLVIGEEVCEITDYKTGEPDDHHADQLRLYSLIWSRDEEHNPRGLPVRRLTLSYPTHDVDVAPLDTPSLNALAVTTTKAIEAAECALQERPPPAFPQAEICGCCGVRQLCDDYWESRRYSAASPDDRFDFEGTVVKRNGSRSWLLAATAEPVLLLRMPSETVPFEIGDRLRFLNLRRVEDEEVVLPVAVFTSASEMFSLTDAG